MKRRKFSLLPTLLALSISSSAPAQQEGGLLKGADLDLLRDVREIAARVEALRGQPERIGDPHRVDNGVEAQPLAEQPRQPGVGIEHCLGFAACQRAPRGDNGFGYDPVFHVPGHDCSSAELDPETKNSLSHRGKALACIVQMLSRS